MPPVASELVMTTQDSQWDDYERVRISSERIVVTIERSHWAIYGFVGLYVQVIRSNEP